VWTGCIVGACGLACVLQGLEERGLGSESHKAVMDMVRVQLLEAWCLGRMSANCARASARLIDLYAWCTA